MHPDAQSVGQDETLAAAAVKMRDLSAEGTPIWVDADSDIDEVLRTMEHSAARALVHASERARLVVVGSRGLGGFTGL